MANCPTCGRTVESVFDHIDVECQNWPDRSEIAPLVYRNYDVDLNTIVGGFDFVHREYDEGDKRHGHMWKLDDVFREIDELEDE